MKAIIAAIIMILAVTLMLCGCSTMEPGQQLQTGLAITTPFGAGNAAWNFGFRWTLPLTNAPTGAGAAQGMGTQ